ncbi:MAG: hypothetical protein LBJ82_04210, partial [Deltaproteobacteria bacterium]|nr:hypothetical protein [Deltaproteobacteria bacterium]
ALAADLVLLTPFALDHQAVLGPTLKDIARDKAGAIRPRAPVVSARQNPEARTEILRIARDKKAPLFFVRDSLEGASPPCALADCFKKTTPPWPWPPGGGPSRTAPANPKPTAFFRSLLWRLRALPRPGYPDACKRFPP